MKRIISLFLTLLCLVSLFSCTQGGNGTVPSVENAALGFRFSYPEGWTLSQNDSLIQITKSLSESVSITAFEMTLSEGKELSALLSEAETSLTTGYQSVTVDTRDLKRDSDGAQWHSFIYTVTQADGGIYRLMQSFAVKDRRVAVLTLSVDKERFSDYNKQFEAMLDSFVFLEKQASTLTKGPLTVTNDAVEYQLNCPEGWNVLRNDGMIALGTPDGASLSSSAFSIDSSVTSLDGYMRDHYFAEFQKAVGSYQLIGDYEALTVENRYSALRCEYTATFDSTPYRFLHLLVSRAGVIYSFLYTAEEGEFALHAEDARAIFDSIRFTKG